jgi:hypothetical protein
VIPVTTWKSWDVTDIRLFLIRKYFLNFRGFLESSAPDPRKTLLRQKFSRQGKVNPPYAEVFPATSQEFRLVTGITR